MCNLISQDDFLLCLLLLTFSRISIFSHDPTLPALFTFSGFLRLSTSRMFVGDMEGVHSYVEGICERNGLVGVVEDDMEGVHSSQFLGKNGEEWAKGGSFLFFIRLFVGRIYMLLLWVKSVCGKNK
ncbi:hypothetical protein Hanom_Chr10g00884891 [Helianthus anomalus]